jgi:hypothetical protein
MAKQEFATRGFDSEAGDYGFITTSIRPRVMRDDGDYGFVVPNTLNFFQRESSVYDRVGIRAHSFVMKRIHTYDCPCENTPDAIHIHYKWNDMYPYIYVKGEDRFRVDSADSPHVQLVRGERIMMRDFDQEYWEYVRQKYIYGKADDPEKLLPLVLITPERATLKDPKKQREFDQWCSTLNDVIEEKKKEAPDANEDELIDTYTSATVRVILKTDPSFFDTGS